METIDEWIGALKRAGKRILVEGKKDRDALMAFGIENVHCVSGKPVYRVVESINAREVVILTDLDREGKRLYHVLKEALQRRKVKVDRVFREFLFAHTELSHMEGLVSYARRTS